MDSSPTGQSDRQWKDALWRKWEQELKKYVEVLITAPLEIGSPAVLGEIRELTFGSIQLHWAAECTTPGPVNEHSSFRRTWMTEIRFSVFGNVPSAGSDGTLSYLMSDSRILMLRLSRACSIPPGNVEGLCPDEHNRMVLRYAAYQALKA